MCRALSRQLPHASAELLRSVSSHGLCPIDGPRESARYRDLSEGLGFQAVPRGPSRFHCPQHLSRGQRKTRLAHFCRFRWGAHPASQTALCPGILRGRSGASRLRLGFDHHRTLLEFVPLGPISSLRSRHQSPCPARPERQSSPNGLCHPGPPARRQHPGPVVFRAGSHLHLRSSLSGLCSPSRHSSSSGLLHYPSPSQFPLSTAPFSSGATQLRSDLRSDDPPEELLSPPRLSRSTAPHPLSGSSTLASSDFFDQQFPAACSSDRPTLSVPLADRTLLQVDQTALAHQSVFRNLGERRQNSDLDRHLCLCPGRHYQKTPKGGYQAL